MNKKDIKCWSCTLKANCDIAFDYNNIDMQLCRKFSNHRNKKEAKRIDKQSKRLFGPDPSKEFLK